MYCFTSSGSLLKILCAFSGCSRTRVTSCGGANILEIAMTTKVRSAFPFEGQEGGESKMAVCTCIPFIPVPRAISANVLAHSCYPMNARACVIRQYLPRIYNRSAVCRVPTRFDQISFISKSLCPVGVSICSHPREFSYIFIERRCELYSFHVLFVKCDLFLWMLVAAGSSPQEFLLSNRKKKSDNQLKKNAIFDRARSCPDNDISHFF